MFGNLQLAVASKHASQFTEALTQDQISANYDLQIGPKWSYCFINGFSIVSTENLAWELWLFNSATNLTSDPQTDGLVGMWAFSATMAGGVGFTVTPAATGVANPLFRYYINGNMIPYTDLDYNSGANGIGYPKLHMRLVNRSAAAKTAGAGGALTITAFVSSQAAQA